MKSKKLWMTVFGIASATYLAKNPNEVSVKALEFLQAILMTYLIGQSAVDVGGKVSRKPEG